MFFHPFSAFYQRADYRHTAPTEALFLLDDRFHIIAFRPCNTVTDLPVAEYGARFFDLFPAERHDLAFLEQICASGTDLPYLMEAGGRAVLMLCGSFRQTGLLLAAIPCRELALVLDRPAAYWDSLTTVHLSSSLQARHQPMTEEGYALIRDWLRLMLSPWHIQDHAEPVFLSLTALFARAAKAADICKCDLIFDVADPEAVKLADHRLPTWIGTLLAVMLLTHDTAKELVLSPEHRPLESTVFCITLDGVSDAALAGLQFLRSTAQSRARLFEISTSVNDPSRVYIHFTVQPRQLSSQGIKDPFATTPAHGGPIEIDDDDSPVAAAPAHAKEQTYGVPLASLLNDAQGPNE